jgi:hypothetical protein
MASIALKDAVLYRALRLAQITRGPGRIATPDQFQDALGALNGMLDSLNVQHDGIYSVNNNQYTLTPPKTNYTIGLLPTGPQTADFQVPRPIRIDQARLVLTNSPTPVYLPLALATHSEWATIVVRKVQTTVPRVLYCDYGYPLANLYFWGYPTSACNVELWTWQPFTAFTTITDNVIFPSGYVDMLVYNLAVRLADQFGTVLPPNVQVEARRTLARVKALNSPSTPMGSNDSGTRDERYRGGSGTRGDFNYYAGL